MRTQQGLSPEEISTVKESTAAIRVEKEVTEERLHPLLEKRNGLSYGRLFLERSASSFEVRTSPSMSVFLKKTSRAKGVGMLARFLLCILLAVSCSPRDELT